jgi:phosphatidylserine/phosphatidylglycerophosphate/cardiolipin synthase-like enzyme
VRVDLLAAGSSDVPVVDGERCLVGSFDVNQLERRNTAEVAVRITDPALGRAIHRAFRAFLERSNRFTPDVKARRSRLGRAAERLAHRWLR